jgi:hypothetical protein
MTKGTMTAMRMRSSHDQGGELIAKCDVAADQPDPGPVDHDRGLLTLELVARRDSCDGGRRAASAAT